MTNLLTREPKRSQPGVAIMVRTMYKQLSPEEVHAQADRVIAQLQEHCPQAAPASGGLADALPDILAFTAFPVSHWQKLWSNTRWSNTRWNDSTWNDSTRRSVVTPTW